MAAAESYADAARKAANGDWRRPRAKIYDYNQEFGGNYYQPMIRYINTKDCEGPFHEPSEVYLPDRAEVVSNKFSNMRYEDRAPVDLDLDRFLTRAYKKQIKELNSSTAMARVGMIHSAASVRNQPHSPLDNVNTRFDSLRLLKGAPPGRERVHHYASELGIIKKHQEEYERRRRRHLSDVINFGQFDYHHNLYDGAVDRNYKFFVPELIADYVRKI